MRLTLRSRVGEVGGLGLVPGWVLAAFLLTRMADAADGWYDGWRTGPVSWRGGRSGLVGGLGLVLGGLAAFLLSMVTQPAGDGWLESGQWIAIGAMMVGVVVFSAAKERV